MREANYLNTYPRFILYFYDILTCYCVCLTSFAKLHIHIFTAVAKKDTYPYMQHKHNENGVTLKEQNLSKTYASSLNS